MEFTLSITGSNPAELQSFLAAFSGTSLQVNGASVPPKKPTKQAPVTDDAAGPALPIAVAAPAPAPAASAASEPEETKTVAAASATTNGAVSIEQVRAAVKAKTDADSANRTIVKDLLSEFGAENVTKLDPAKYADFLNRVNAL